ncbi:hypothetical protein WISP_68256 [Willisornis vidua]|uniref:Uncharacterized protein n=1 Tax=Willisornis vidua TaxID=1566151 RepID=A0ABQ9DE42_9PASS|nr:hypothetical protein WISP_68256 [Willisornis vidua]
MVTSQTGTELFNALFASIFNSHDRPRGSQCPELEDHDCENDQLPVDPELVWDLVFQLDPYKPVGPDRIHPRIFKELIDVITKPVFMILNNSACVLKESSSVMYSVSPYLPIGDQTGPLMIVNMVNISDLEKNEIIFW